MEIKLKYIAIASAVIIFIISGLIWYTSYLNGIIKDKENTIKVDVQNIAALNDQMKMKADSIQNFAVFVTNLQKDNANSKNEYKILQSKYYILIDSIKVLNQPAKVDTNGNKIKVLFDGKKGKVSYDGYTIYYKETGKGTYSITIAVDSSTINSQIYLDTKNNLIKNRIYVDGALIANAKTEIDSSIYLLIQNHDLKCPDAPGFFDRLQLLFDAQQSFRKTNLTYKSTNFSMGVGAQYQFNDVTIFSEYDYINSEITAGVQYTPSIKQVWKLIF